MSYLYLTNGKKLGTSLDYYPVMIAYKNYFKNTKVRIDLGYGIVVSIVYSVILNTIICTFGGTAVGIYDHVSFKSLFYFKEVLVEKINSLKPDLSANKIAAVELNSDYFFDEHGLMAYVLDYSDTLLDIAKADMHEKLNAAIDPMIMELHGLTLN
jgi:hypothetical protein